MPPSPSASLFSTALIPKSSAAPCAAIRKATPAGRSAPRSTKFWGAPMSPQATMPRPCGKCAGCFIVNLADDGRTYCLRCKIDRGALSAEVQTFISVAEQHFGPLTEPIVLRTKDATQTKADRHLINLALAEKVQV
jgi:hypothetical protein